MAEASALARATGAKISALVAVGLFALGIGAGVTSAAWVDNDYFAAQATSSSFDIQVRYSTTSEWADVGLPGSPDTFPDGAELVIPPIADILPSHSYLADVFLCNNGNVDGVVTTASLIETRDINTQAPDNDLVLDSSIEVTGIDIGMIVPAHSCPPSNVEDPPNDLEGVLHFTTNDSFAGSYGSSTKIVIKVFVGSR